MTREPDAAVAIVHARASDAVLLMRRSERDDDPWSGHWSFPGGRRNARDSGLLETALRELAEECGIQLAARQLERALPAAVARRRVGRFLHVAPFVFRVDAEKPATPDFKEAVEAVWVPLDGLRDPARHALRNVPGVPPEVRFPAIDLNGVPLWGFTYRLITEWLEMLPEQPAEASFAAACALLDRLVARGCLLDHEWVNLNGSFAASVHGPIPPAPIVAGDLALAEQIPPVNLLEVRPDRIRVVGLAFEEYTIQVVD